MSKSNIIANMLFFLSSSCLILPLGASNELDLNASSVALVELNSSRILYSKAIDQPIAPASLTKMMSLHLAYKALEQGKADLDSMVTISPNAYYYNQPTGSSIMELDGGQQATFKDLMLGLALPSGNDGAVALAENLAGSVENFVTQMNAEAQRLGLTQTYFTDPAGVVDGNITTARDWASFAQFYVKEHPYALVDLHSVLEFQYPRPENFGTSRKHFTNTFRNRNNLLRTYPGTDGIKTGYVDEAGYNVTATVLRDQMRLVAVILGVQAPNSTIGSALRTADAEALFNYGFSNYRMVFPAQDEGFSIKKIKLFGSPVGQVTIKAAAEQGFLFKNDEVEAITYQNISTGALAPVNEGDLVGHAVLNRIDGNRELINLYATQSYSAEPFMLYLNAKLSWALKQLVMPLLFKEYR